MSNESNHNRIDDAMNISRRKAVKTIAGGIGAVAAYHTFARYLDKANDRAGFPSCPWADIRVCPGATD